MKPDVRDILIKLNQMCGIFWWNETCRKYSDQMKPDAYHKVKTPVYSFLCYKCKRSLVRNAKSFNGIDGFIQSNFDNSFYQF